MTIGFLPPYFIFFRQNNDYCQNHSTVLKLRGEISNVGYVYREDKLEQ